MGLKKKHAAQNNHLMILPFEKQLFHYVLKLHGNLPIKSVSVANMHSWPSIAYHKQTNSVAVIVANIPSLQTLVTVAAAVAAGCNILSQ